MVEQSELEASGSGIKYRLILGVLASGVLAAFVLQNTHDARVNFLWLDGDIPLFLLLLVTVGLTLILTFMTGWFLRRRDRK